ncbi:6255_t:CDS:1, partial [Scutellospora calospora]
LACFDAQLSSFRLARSKGITTSVAYVPSFCSLRAILLENATLLR